MNIKTETPGQTEQEMLGVLERLLAEDAEITARAVARLHPTLKAASSITRNTVRSALLSQFQERQAEFRRWRSRTAKLSASDSAATLAALEQQVSNHEATIQLLTASHIAMLRTVGALGGFAKWAQFYESYAAVRTKLEALDKTGMSP